MGHQTHFLERLERTSADEAELALELYRSPHAVRYLLARAGPEDLKDGQRLALSLAEDDRGPYVIVEVDGAFVTCLGREMALGDAVLVAHEQLKAYLAQARELVEHDQLRRRLADEEHVDVSDWNWPLKAGLDVGREEISAFRPLQPALAGFRLFRAGHAIDQVVRSLPEMKRIRRPKKQHRALLKSFWDAYWSIGHELVLSAMNGPAGLGQAIPHLDKAGHHTVRFTFALGSIPLGARALWAAGKLGKRLVPGLKEIVWTGDDPLMWLGAVAALTVIGLRHRKLHGEVMSAIKFDGGKKGAGPETARFLLENDVTDLVDVLMASGDLPQEQEALNAELCQQVVFEYFAEPRPEALGADSPKALPPDHARCILINEPLHYSASPEYLRLLFGMIPWLARVEAEDLYLTREQIAAELYCPFESECAVEIIQDLVTYLKPSQVRFEDEKVGRNEPCPCGSGKKYKKCCLRREREDPGPTE